MAIALNVCDHPGYPLLLQGESTDRSVPVLAHLGGNYTTADAPPSMLMEVPVR